MKRGMLRYCIVCFLIFSSHMSYSQYRIELDSLKWRISLLKEDTNKVNLLLKLGNKSFQVTYNYPNSISYAKEAIQLSRKLKFKRGEGLGYNLLGDIYRRRVNFSKAIESHLLALNILEKLRDTSGVGDCYFYIGDVFKDMRGYDRSLIYFNKALEKFREVKDTIKVGKCLDKMGYVSMEKTVKLSGKEAIDMIKKALSYYHQTLDLYSRSGRQNNIASSYVNIADAYLTMGDFSKGNQAAILDTSIFYSNLSLNISKNIKGSALVCLNLLNIAEAYERMNNEKRAFEYYFSAEKEADLIGHLHWKTVSLMRMGRMYLKNGDYSKSKLYLEKSVKMSTDIGASREMLENYKLLSDVYLATRDFEKAYTIQKKITLLNDSIQIEETKRAATLIQVEFESVRKDKEIALLNKNHELQSAKLKQEKSTKYYLIAGVFLVFLLLVLTYSRYRAKLNTTKIIEEKNKELEKLSIVARETANGVFIMDAEGELVWFNEGFTKLFGWNSVEEYKRARGGNIFEVSGHKDIAKIIEKCKKEKISITYESINLTKDGRELWVKASLSPVFDSDGQLKNLVIVDTDITELKKAKEIAERSLEIQEQFLANTSHEIRTPMNGVIGMTRQLLETPLSKEQTEYLSAIKESSNSLLHVVNDVLDISKIKAGKIVFEKTEFRLQDLFKNLQFTLQYRIDEKNIYFTTMIDEQLPNVLIGDPVRLNQILLNLSGNAIKFTESGGIIVSAKLVSKSNNSSKIEFMVKDTGIGIPDDKLDYVFESFAQAETHTTRKYGGTGLGLTISKSLVEEQGGSIWINSKLNEGSEFHFSIDFEHGNPNWQGVISKQTEGMPDNIDLSQLRILLVDDNKINQRVALFELDKWKIKTDVANNAKEAFEKLEEKNFDLILMDISMPDISGLEATKYIRSKFPEPTSTVPIIAMTASALAGEKENCFAAGMNDYLSKPFDPVLLYKKIVKWGEKNNAVIVDEDDPVIVTKRSRLTNLSIIRNYASGDMGYIKEMIRLYLESMPPYLKELNDLYLQKKWIELGTVAHKMKSPVAYFGGNELKDVLAGIEIMVNGECDDLALEELMKQVNLMAELSLTELKNELDKIS